MHIVSLQAENFKRLKAVEITPTDDNTVVIAGRNAQGKSSVLDAIWAALAGKAGAKELKRPIRDGEKKARVVVELDDLVVERKWTPSGSTVTVSPKGSNAKLNSPQKVLDELIGALSFDPLAFAEAEPKRQVETLIDLIGREEFDRLAAERKAAYDNRTDMNREARRLQSAIDTMSADGVPLKVAEVSASKLSIELEGAIEVERARGEWQAIEDRIADLREKQERLAAAAKAVVEKVAPRASDEIREEMRRVDDINRKAQRYIDYSAARDQLAKAEEVSAKHTALIESVDQQKAALIASADLPVEGLSFDEDGVLFNGVPFGQSSAAERLKVSVGMAMGLNPDLRVICIRDASLLDDDSKNALVELAKEHDYQIWYEVVGNTAGELGVVIEDGEVQA